MIKIKALNDQQSEYSDSSDSECRLTQEAEEEELNGLYLDALKFASEDDMTSAIKLLKKLKNELEIDDTRIKDAFLLKRLKYLVYKNLGMFLDDLDYILDALEIDDSDINLWITAGKKSKEKYNYLLSKHCFEKAFKFNQSNFMIIENLIDLYFITNNLYRCVSVCLEALKIDSTYLKARILLNECIRLMPPLLKDLPIENMIYISPQFGGQDYDLLDEDIMCLSQEILKPINLLKSQQFRNETNEEDNEGSNNKRKELILNLNRTECSSFEKIGFKIKNIYDLIQKRHYNICTRISIDFTETSTFLPNAKSISDNTENNQQNNDNENDFCSIEKLKQKANNEKQMLYEYADKRRSSRFKTKTKNSDFYDDQSLFDNLINLLPEKIRVKNIDDNGNDYNKQAIDSDYISASNSTSINENEFNSETKTIEMESIEKFFQKIKILSNDSAKKPLNIFDLISFYLIETFSIKNITIPKIATTLYKLYREHYQLPCGTLCQIGKDIEVDMIMTCLAANEIEYSQQETLFLKQILFKLNLHLDLETYRQFLIRLFVLCGVKELNIDFLYYALDFCLTNTNYLKYFQIPKSFQKIKNDESGDSNEEVVTDKIDSSYEVIATNKLKINCQYINTLIDMQNVSIDKLSNDQNYAEIIRLFFTKSECDLSNDEKEQLCDAIIKAELWQKGLDFLQDWKHLDNTCLQTILRCVTEKRARLPPKLIRKIVKKAVEGNTVISWLILYWCFQTEDVEPSSMCKFFQMGHNVLGRRGLCCDNQGEFLLLAQKFFLEQDQDEEAEMCFSCLFNFPPRKSLQLQDSHTSPHIDLKWEYCSDIYEYFAPEQMPEFDSHARQSGILTETKDFFVKILDLIPDDQKPKHTHAIINYLKRNKPIQIPEKNGDQSIITSTIYYLLADHYFKAKDFDKAKYFYINDLALNVNRFDSWAGLGLSLNFQLDQMLLEGKNTDSENFHQLAFSTMQCLEKALELKQDTCKIWIEYGLLCYAIASNWSRLIKKSKILNSTEKPINNSFYRFEEILPKTKYCFERIINDFDYNEESWLSYYMLGKVAEKKKNDIFTILQYYEWAYLQIYLDGAVYPKKISYYNPAHFSIEALEIHYRIHSCVLKYLLNNRKFTARNLRLLKFNLVKANRSPFVLRKPYNGNWYYNKKQNNINNNSNEQTISTLPSEDQQQLTILIDDMISLVAEKREIDFDVKHVRDELIQMCINGIKKCLLRYSAHYKSYYRLAHYFNEIQDFQTAKAIMCGGTDNKKNALLKFEIDPEKPNSNPGYISGLFMERKSTNLYNGVWRIPVDEIERPGNFNFHMYRCTDLWIDVCTMTQDCNLLVTIAQQLFKQPDHDKKYVNDTERQILSKKAFDKCFQILQTMLSNSTINNRAYIIEQIQNIIQNFFKNNIYVKETIEKCKTIENQLNHLNTTTAAASFNNNQSYK